MKLTIRQRMTLDPNLQRVHNEISDSGDRDVGIAAVLIVVAAFLLMIAGVI